MTYKNTATILFGHVLVILLAESHSQQIPPELANYAVNKVDNWLSCSRFDGAPGMAGCWFKNEQKRNMICEDDSCGRKQKFSYGFWTTGTCYCCRC